MTARRKSIEPAPITGGPSVPPEVDALLIEFARCLARALAAAHHKAAKAGQTQQDPAGDRAA